MRAEVVLASRRVPLCPRPRVSRRDWPCEMSEGRVERRLAAILAVDVAGYSRFVTHKSSPRLWGSKSRPEGWPQRTCSLSASLATQSRHNGHQPAGQTDNR